MVSYFITFNPRPTLEKVKVPVLAINGEEETIAPAVLETISNWILKRTAGK